MKKVVLKVTGMSCDACVSHVKKALTRMPGVTSTQVSLQSNRAEVEFDEALADIDQMIESVQREGYDATVNIAETPR